VAPCTPPSRASRCSSARWPTRVATLATGNLMLGFAAILLGLVVGLERRASGGVLAPVLTHVTWSTAMLFLLPLIF
jgi:uncharacterized protein